MDIQMFTILDMNSNQTLGAGVQVVGRTSGARGYTTEAFSNAGHIDLIQVEGSFIKNEMLTVDGINLDTIDNIHTYQFSDVRQLVSRDETTSVIEFTGDIILEDIQPIQGSIHLRCYWW